MMLFDQVMVAIQSKQPFTLYPFHVGTYKPDGDVVHEMEKVEVGKIGYLLQWWAQSAIYKNKTISFNWAQNCLQIIYRANTSAKIDSDDGPDPLVPDRPSKPTPEGGEGGD
jgi:hypothetical protein